MVAYVIRLWLILRSWCAYWKCNKILTWKEKEFSSVVDLQQMSSSDPKHILQLSALITADESHGTRPIKPHYLDRENMREQDHWSVKGRGERKMAIISCLLADLPGEADIFGGPQKSGGDTALSKDSGFVSIWHQVWPKPQRIKLFPNEHRPEQVPICRF